MPVAGRVLRPRRCISPKRGVASPSRRPHNFTWGGQMMTSCLKKAGGGGGGADMAVLVPPPNMGAPGIDGHESATGARRGWSVGPVIKPTAKELPCLHPNWLRPSPSPRNRRGHGNGSSDKTVVDSRKALPACGGKDTADVVERHNMVAWARKTQAKRVAPPCNCVPDAGSNPAASTKDIT